MNDLLTKHRVKLFFYSNLFWYRIMLDFKYPSSKATNPDIKDVLVCSVQRSGSTLLFNLISSILAEHKKKHNPFFSDMKSYNRIYDKEISLLVKKTHNYMPIIGKRLKQNKTKAFFSHRDIRDVVTSAYQKGMIRNIDDWLNTGGLHKFVNDSLIYRKHKNVTSISYQDLTENTASVVKKIEDVLEIRLSDALRNKIINENSLDRTKKKISEIPVDKKLLFHNQFHKNHIADGKSQKWNEYLTKEQISRINHIAKEYQIIFGYNK